VDEELRYMRSRRTELVFGKGMHVLLCTVRKIQVDFDSVHDCCRYGGYAISSLQKNEQFLVVPEARAA